MGSEVGGWRASRRRRRSTDVQRVAEKSGRDPWADRRKHKREKEGRDETKKQAQIRLWSGERDRAARRVVSGREVKESNNRGSWSGAQADYRLVRQLLTALAG